MKMDEDCPRCTARGVIGLSETWWFCPWCLYEWEPAALLAGGPGSGEEQFVEALEKAISPKGAGGGTRTHIGKPTGS